MSKPKGKSYAFSGWLLLPLCLALLSILAATSKQASTQPGPFATLVPFDVTFTPPVGGQATSQPGFAALDFEAAPVLAISKESSYTLQLAAQRSLLLVRPTGHPRGGVL